MQFLTKLAITALFATPLLAAPIPIADADADAKADPINMDSLKGIFSNENRNPLIAGAAIGAVGAIGAKELYDHEFKKTTSTLVATATRVATATAA
ncbi:hypothetical protein DASC09_036280 [Saccharomycopsis crataegensis]|uniref:Uncharacterized protein n=1 Tax=Saccharomycopsis crataegensis TaxID=43959 RepID=A0AAV5QN42_9ASCO|nr:hypothetical protein DASC09_036280 [Saccharomycopsis crataegensis]